MSSFSRSKFLPLITLTILLHSQSIPNPAAAFSKTLFFHFPPFSGENLLLLGTSALLNDSLCLAKTNFGAAVFLRPIAITPLVSFSTTFSFSFSTPNPDPHATIAFFLLPNLPTQALLHSPQTLERNSLFFLQFPTNSTLTTSTTTITVHRKNPGLSATVSSGNSRLTIKQETLKSTPNPIYAGLLSTNNNSNSDPHHIIQTWTLSSQPARRAALQSTKSPIPRPDILLRATILASSFAVVAIAGLNLNQPPTPNPPKRGKEKQFLIKNLRKFKLGEIQSATNNFADLIGRGGSARVYKMNFPPSSSAFLAVKRFTNHDESRRSYRNELETITRVQHDGILALKGWCDHPSGEHLLVYDYMPRGSLHQVLHSDPVLPWPQRRAIAAKLAAAVHHLHHECRPPIAHCDVKCRNVMITDEWEPRLADFGMSRVGGRRQGDGAGGSRNSGFDEKWDVGCFGKVLIEVCTGRMMQTEMAEGFVDEARGMEGEGRLLEAADERLGNAFEAEDMLRMLRLGLVCACGDKERRPTMEWVLKVMNGEVEVEDFNGKGKMV